MDTSSPTPSLRSNVYSFRHATEVIYSFENKYSRVLIFVAKKLGKEPREFRDSLIKLYMYRNPRWNITREVLKRVQNYNMIPDMAHYSRAEFIKYLTSVRVDVEDDVVDGKIRI